MFNIKSASVRSAVMSEEVVLTWVPNRDSCPVLGWFGLWSVIRNRLKSTLRLGRGGPSFQW